MVPYGLWSEKIAGPSMDEFGRRAAQIEAVFAEALAHFGLSPRAGSSLSDLARGAASLIEGVWLNQCLARAYLEDSDLPISETLVRAGSML